MQIFVYSRLGLGAAQPHEVPHVVLSTTSGPEDVARLRQNRECRGVLRLVFPDAEEASELQPEESLFSPAQAKQVWEFVQHHQAQIERIVVHCDAGKSRSPAVAAALARVLNGDDAEYFAGRYSPNMRVYRLLLEASGSAG